MCNPYTDSEGNPCASLEQLVIREPEWAANMIRSLRAHVALLQDALEWT